MMRTCIYGGSFNPIHNGHIALAQQILDDDMADEVWFVVSPLNPFKQNVELLPDEQRLAMTAAALQGKIHMQVSDCEFYLPRPSYMVNTLSFLRREYPDHNFSLLIGADNWLSFHRWYRYEEIISHHTIYIYPRNDIEIDKISLPSTVHLLNYPLIDISSTEIRGRLYNKEEVNGSLPDEVADMIKNKRYYQ